MADATPTRTPRPAAGTSRSENDLLMQRRASTAASLGLGMQLVLAIVAWVLAILGQGYQFATVLVFATAGLIPWITILVATAFRKAAFPGGCPPVRGDFRPAERRETCCRSGRGGVR